MPLRYRDKILKLSEDRHAVYFAVFIIVHKTNDIESPEGVSSYLLHHQLSHFTRADYQDIDVVKPS